MLQSHETHFDLSCIYTVSVQFGSIWTESNLTRVSLNSVGFTGAPYHHGTVQFQTGSLSQVNRFGTR